MPKGVPKDKSVKRSITHQLRICKGHLEKVIKMVEGDAYCIDIVHQSIAVQKALKKIDQKILDNHMRTCVADSIKKGKDREVINEVMKVMEKI